MKITTQRLEIHPMQQAEWRDILELFLDFSASPAGPSTTSRCRPARRRQGSRHESGPRAGSFTRSACGERAG